MPARDLYVSPPMIPPMNREAIDANLVAWRLCGPRKKLRRLVLFRQETRSEYRSAVKSWYKVLSTMVGRSSMDKSLERVTCPAAWKARMATGQRSRKLGHLVGFLLLPDEKVPVSKGLLETRDSVTSTAAMVMKIVWTRKEVRKMSRRRDVGCSERPVG